MGIRRVGKKRYVYWSIRIGSRVTTRYLGEGRPAVAELARIKRATARTRRSPADPGKYRAWLLRQLDRGTRENKAELRAEQRAEFLRERRLVEADGARVEALASEAVELARGLMLDAGFHKHHRMWRRKRGSMPMLNLPLTIESLAKWVAENPRRRRPSRRWNTSGLRRGSGI